MAVTSPRLKAYLELERQMLALDEAGDPLADTFREVMDPLWYQLSDEEHAQLDARTIASVAGGPIRAPIGSELFLSPPRPAQVTRLDSPIRVDDWGCAA